MPLSNLILDLIALEAIVIYKNDDTKETLAAITEKGIAAIQKPNRKLRKFLSKAQTFLKTL